MNSIKISISGMYTKGVTVVEMRMVKGGGGEGGETKSDSILRAAVHCCKFIKIVSL